MHCAPSHTTPQPGLWSFSASKDLAAELGNETVLLAPLPEGGCLDTLVLLCVTPSFFKLRLGNAEVSKPTPKPEFESLQRIWLSRTGSLVIGGLSGTSSMNGRMIGRAPRGRGWGWVARSDLTSCQKNLTGQNSYAFAASCGREFHTLMMHCTEQELFPGGYQIFLTYAPHLFQERRNLRRRISSGAASAPSRCRAGSWTSMLPNTGPTLSGHTAAPGTTKAKSTGMMGTKGVAELLHAPPLPEGHFSRLWCPCLRLPHSLLLPRAVARSCGSSLALPWEDSRSNKFEQGCNC